MDAIPQALRGVHPRNPVNLPRQGGAQLELPPRCSRHRCAPYRAEYEEAVVEALARVAMAETGPGWPAPFLVFLTRPHIGAVSSPD